MSTVFDKNPYEILGILPNSTDDEIKKAYRLKALQYHPDKCNDKNAVDMFRDIHTSYEILKDSNNRKKYDTLENNDKTEFYDVFKQYITKQHPNFNDFFTTTINLFYNDENDFKNDFKNCSFVNIYGKIINKIPEVLKTIDPIKYCTQQPINTTNSTKSICEKKLDIYGKLTCSLKDRYLNRYSKIKVDRDTKESIFIYVPFRNNISIYENEGECYNNISGCVVIEVEVEKPENYFIIDNDIHIIHEVPLYDYLYGGDINISHIDGEIINIKIPSMVNNKDNIIIVPDKGLPYNLTEPIYKTTEPDSTNILRGSLKIHINVYKLEELRDKIKKIY
jgi:DnaJ-class molecular chaperone